MQQIRFNYSLKNIGLPRHDDYRRNLIDKTESVIQRMRWKAYFFLHNNNETSNKREPTFGLKSKRAPPPIPEMKPFEEDIAKMLENVSFRNVNNEFITNLENDKKRINSSPNVFVFADKTTNLYEMDAASYNKLLTENITKTYKPAQNNTIQDINTELKDIATKLKVGNRTETMAESQAFISLKDHKDDFEIHPKCRLINPAKSNFGKVSKSILDRINTKIRNETQATQWRNSDDTISWFESIKDKNKHRFLSFDIVDFYPSISEELLDQAIEWGKQFTSISESDIKIIKHARKSLLFNNGRAWTKRSSNNMFDVTMGSFDGAEICELVGLFILHSLEKKFGKQIGLYRDDGLAAIKSTSGRVADKARKDLIRTFDSFGLKITAQANLERVNFLDITFDLTNGTYKPYRKPNDDPLYINRLSNHPPTIIRQLPTSINKRINKLSCNQETFETAKPLYNDALKQSNFDTELTYEPTTEDENRNHSQRHVRRRNTIWYNPPYSVNVKTNVGRIFLQLIDKHFPATNKLHQIFNRHTVRVSYSCMENMQTVIRKHNNTILTKYANRQNETTKHTNQQNAATVRANQQNTTTHHANQQNTATSNATRNNCNCRQANLCPLNGNCLAKSVIYQAEINHDGSTKTYIGITSGDFKTRYRNHAKSFRHKKYSQETELSKYIWELKSKNRKINIKWSIIKTIPAYKPGARRCNLCLEEKLQVMKRRSNNTLNKRSELFSTCRHVTRHLISQ